VALLALASALLGALRPGGPGDPHDALNLVVATASLGLAGFSLAGFLVLPHVLMGQVIDLDERRTGANRSAMFYGVQGLLTKWVYQVSLALMSFLLVRFGSSPEEPLGVVLIGPVAALLCVVSLGFWALYPERRVLDEAAAAAGEEAA
jgi:Na+/melibiose symporter-like transporter